MIVGREACVYACPILNRASSTRFLAAASYPLLHEARAKFVYIPRTRSVESVQQQQKARVGAKNNISNRGLTI